MRCRPALPLLLIACVLIAGCGGVREERPTSPNGADSLVLLPELKQVQAALDSGDMLRAGSLARRFIASRGSDTMDMQYAVAVWMLGSAMLARAQHDSAGMLLTHALELTELHGDSTRSASIRKELAMNFEARGDYPRALQMLMRSLRFQEQQGDSPRIANTILSLGKIYYMQDDDRSARREFERAYAINKALGDSAGMSFSLNNVTRVMVEHGEYDTAITLLRYNIALRKRVMPKRSRAALESNLSSAYLGILQWDSALAHARVSLEEAEKYRSDDMRALGWLGIARALKGKGRYPEALDAANKSLDIAIGAGRPEQVSEAYKVLGTIQRERGDLAEALRLLDRHNAMEDSLVNAKRDSEMLALRARYEVDQKEWENERLRTKQHMTEAQAGKARWGMLAALAGAAVIALVAWAMVQRTRHRSRQRELELEQQVLRSQMDPHFLFNALNSIPGMYAEGGHGMADDHVAHLSMFLRTVLETSRHRAVPLSRELTLVEHYLCVCANRNPGHFSWTITVDPDLSADRIAVPPMIVQPIVENALGHGIAAVEHGSIRVHVGRVSQDLVVTVTDNGIGRAAAAKLASRRNASSMGLDLVRQRLALFDRGRSNKDRVSIEDMAIENGTSTGTRVTLRMTLKYLDQHATVGDR